MPAGATADDTRAGATERPAGAVALAIGAAWVVPGLGHVLLGRVRRGLLFGGLLLGCYGLGLAHDGRLALRDQRQPFLTTLQLVANLGIGPIDLAARMWAYGGPAYVLPANFRSLQDRRRSEIFRERARSGLSMYGTAYVWTAGLMNLLLLFDVWDVGRGKKKKRAEAA
jgi:hypothetical protein